MKKQEIEAMYPTTQMQQAMLFHGLYAPGSGAYITQTSCTFDHIDVDALRGAWDFVLQDTPVLRTVFVWKRIEDVKQVVVKPNVLTMPFTEEDWRDATDEEIAERMELRRAEDRRQGFDVSRAPLVRALVARVSDDSWWFLWTVHHLLLDGWSQMVIFRDVIDAYVAIAMGGEPTGQGRPPFQNYIKWLQKQDIDVARRTWRNELAGFPGGQRLGIDRDVSARYGEAGTYQSERLSLSVETTSKLQARAKKLGVTLNTLVQCAWAALLREYLRSDDVVFGAVSSGRTAPVREIDRMVGMLINTVPVRVRFSDELDVDDWLRAHHRHQGKLREFDFLPLTEIQRCSDAPRGAALYDSVLVYENLPMVSVPDSTGMAVRDVKGGQRVNYPLAVVIWPTEEVTFEFAYDSRRFTGAAMRRIGQHLTQLLEALADHGVTTVGKLRGAGLVRAVAARGPELPLHEGTVIDCIFRHADVRPEAVALVDGDGASPWTYADLARAIDAVAAALMARGVKPGDTVGLMLPRSYAMPTAFFGIMRAGAIVVLMDPTWPHRRQQFVLEDAGAKVVVASEDVPEFDGETLRLDREAIESLPVAPLPPRPAPESLCYIIYTSGSTGVPKGAVMKHSALMQNAADMARLLRLDGASRLGQFTSVAFDACIADICMTMCAGARLCLLPAGKELSAAAFERALTTLGITAIMVPPSYLAAIEVGELPSLQVIVSMGEPLSSSVVERWQPGRLMLNGYGPTEMTICTSFGEVVAGDTDVPGIGIPVANTEVYLLDEQMLPVVHGAAGEVYIAGAAEGVAYWRRRALTAERFVPNPFGRPRSRMYRSGDLARLRDDGSLEFIGRVDQQVKIRGIRVELGEVEHRIRELVGVVEAVATTAGSGAELVMVAFVELEEGILPEDVRGRLAGEVPDAMVPKFIEVVTEWPKTSSGKIDRVSLKARASALFAGRERAAEPVDNTLPKGGGELSIIAKVREIWRDVLQVDTVRDDEDFFEEAGGDSLLAVKLVSRIEKAFGQEVAVTDVFREPTVLGVSRLLAQDEAQTEVAKAAPPWERDSVLAGDVQPRGRATPEAPRRILVTGSTGFVGGWVVQGLLRNEDLEVICLVRGTSKDDARRRLIDSIRKNRGEAEPELERLEVVVGNLGVSRFGLGDEEWERLADRIDCVVHLGAWVNYLHPYERLAPTNVEGTREIIRFCVAGQPKRLIHGSTFGFFDDESGPGALLETARPPSEIAPDRMGYAISKLVSERLIWQAIDRGLDATVCRMPDVAGDTRSGRGNSADLLFLTLGACLRLGLVPALDVGFDVVPVDYIAEAIVRCAISDAPAGHCVHLCHTDKLKLVSLVEAASSEGYALKSVPFEDWLEALLKEGAFGHLRVLWQNMGRTEKTFDRARARELFHRSGPALPSLDSELLRKYVRAAAPPE